MIEEGASVIPVPSRLPCDNCGTLCKWELAHTIAEHHPCYYVGCKSCGRWRKEVMGNNG